MSGVWKSSDGAEDTTFCVRLLTKSSYWGKGKKRAQPWDLEDDAEYAVPGLTTKPAKLLIFRARSKVSRVCNSAWPLMRADLL